MAQLNWAAGRGWLTAGGKRLEWDSHGPAPGKAPTLVLLHEGLGSISLWRDFPKALAEATGLGVFVYSRAGYGQSDPVTLPRPLDYMSREAADVVPEVLDAAGIRRAILLGHSDGATIAAIYAGTVPDHRVRGAILLAPHFFTEPGGLASIAEAREAYATTDLRAKLARHHRDPDNAFRGWNDAWLDPGFADWHVGEVLDTIRVPVLAIQGEGDQYGTRAQITEIEVRCPAPVEVAMLADCGHAPHLEQRERTLDAITDFTMRLMRIEAEEVTVS